MEYEESFEGDLIIAKVYIPKSELLSLKLDSIDQRFMDECSESNLVSDKLLKLEVLARRLEQMKGEKDA